MAMMNLKSKIFLKKKVVSLLNASTINLFWGTRPINQEISSRPINEVKNIELDQLSDG